MIDDVRRLHSRELALYLLTFTKAFKTEQEAKKEEQFREWWKGFTASRGMAALAAFESARLKVSQRTQQSINEDVMVLWRIATACHSASTWTRQEDAGSRYRARIAGARRRRANLAYHARQLAKGLEGWPPGLSWALRAAALKAGVGSIRDKLRKELEELPSVISSEERAKTTKDLKLDQERSIAEMWPEFFALLGDELCKKLPEIDGGPWYRLFTIGNLHYEKRIRGKLPATETMLAFELTFHLRRWSLGQAEHIRSSGERMPKEGRPHNDVAATFINASLSSKRGISADQIGNRLKRLPKTIGLIMWDERSDR